MRHIYNAASTYLNNDMSDFNSFGSGVRTWLAIAAIPQLASNSS